MGVSVETLRSTRQRSWRTWGESCGCAITAAVTYWNTIEAGFVYDDHRAILENTEARWGAPLTSLVTHDFWGTPLHQRGSHGSWRPLTTLTFRLNHWLAGGLRPQGFHVTNVFLHTLVTVLLLLWLRRLLPPRLVKRSVPLFTALLFAVHPLHCEAVAGLVGRAELLQAALSLMALLAYSGHVSSRDQQGHPMTLGYMVLTVIFASAALLAKEQGLMTLAVCGVCDLLTQPSLQRVFRGLMSGNDKSVLPLRRGLQILACSSAALVALRVAVAGGAVPHFAPADNPAAHDSSWWTRTLTFLYLPALNVALFFCPSTLSFDWSMDSVTPVRSWYDIRNLYTLVHYAAITVLLVRGSPAIRQALVITTLFFLPSSNLVAHVGFVLAERVTYAPSIGLCLLVALAVQRTWRRCHQKRTRLLFDAAVVLLLVVLAARAVRRNRDWRDDEALYRSGIVVNPPKAYGNLGSVLVGKGRDLEAEVYYRQALKFRPCMADVHYNLGLLLLQNGGEKRVHEAEQSLRAAVACRPKLAAAHVALGVALTRQGGRDHEAELALSVAANLEVSGQRDPRAHLAARTSAHLHLGRLLLERQRPQEALRQLLMAREEMPPLYHQPQSVYGLLAEAYRRLGRPEKAEPLLMASLEVNPNHLPAHVTLARLLAANESRVNEAENWLKRALDLSPTEPSVLRAYGELLLKRGQPGRAAELLERVLKTDETLRQGHYQDVVNAATARRLAGQLDRAVELYMTARDLRSKYAPAHGNLGACLHLAGHFEEAERSYLRALTLDPNDEVASDNLKRLRSLRTQKRN